MALADVQQKNVTAADASAAHAEAPLTAQFLEPVDGRGMCADNFAVGKSPVNLALTKLRQLVAGLRGAVIGDFAGAVQKTIRSLSVSMSPGATHNETSGTMRISGNPAANVASLTIDRGTLRLADLDAEFAVGANPGGFGFLTSRRLFFRLIDNTAAGSNPPQGTPIPNEIRAVNVPKAFCCVRMSAPNVIDSYDGCGISSVVILGGGFFFTFATEFADTNFSVLTGGYVPTASGFAFPTENIGLRTTTAAFLEFTSAVGVAINAATTRIDGFSIGFFGRQDT